MSGLSTWFARSANTEEKAYLFSIGIPKDSILRYESAIKAGRIALIALGSSTDVAKAREVLKSCGAESIDSHKRTEKISLLA